MPGSDEATMNTSDSFAEDRFDSNRRVYVLQRRLGFD
jgi:hypothetical protein